MLLLLVMTYFEIKLWPFCWCKMFAYVPECAACCVRACGDLKVTVSCCPCCEFYREWAQSTTIAASSILWYQGSSDCSVERSRRPLTEQVPPRTIYAEFRTCVPIAYACTVEKWEKMLHKNCKASELKKKQINQQQQKKAKPVPSR